MSRHPGRPRGTRLAENRRDRCALLKVVNLNRFRGRHFAPERAARFGRNTDRSEDLVGPRYSEHDP